MAYADIDNLIADYIPEATAPAEVEAITRVLDNVSAFVDTYCDRVPGYFDPAGATATAKRVRGEGEHYLRLPVHVFGSISGISIFGTTIDPSNYYESDKNGWVYCEEGIWGIEPGFGVQRMFEEGRIYMVTAKWGYAATPADLEEAVRQFVVSIWSKQRGVLGDVTPEGFVIERAMPLTVKLILDKYKRRQFEI